MDIINPTDFRPAARHVHEPFDGVNLTRERAASTAKPACPCYGLAALFIFAAIITAAWAFDKAQGVAV